MKCRGQAYAVVGEKFLRGIFNDSGGGNVNKYQIRYKGSDRDKHQASAIIYWFDCGLVYIHIIIE